MQVIPQPGFKTVSDINNSDRKPLHPPHLKNRGQEMIQDLIDQEKGVVNNVINQISEKLGKNLRLEVMFIELYNSRGVGCKDAYTCL